MTKTREFFGTDGIRGKVGDSLVTPDFALELGRAIGTVFNSKSKIFIARDPRISSEMLQAALSSGICSTGVSVCDLGVLPTPACAYLTKFLNAEAGIVISASHNPYYDNGIKLFNNNGNKLSDTTELCIENVIFSNRENAYHISPNRIGYIEFDHSLYMHYVHYCLDKVKEINTEASLEKIKKYRIIVDCSNGANSVIAPEVFKLLGLDITVLNNEPNGLNINQQCGAADANGLETLAKKVKLAKADIGISFDGDGDRVILVDNKGNIADGDHILYILACDYLNSGKEIVGVVGTLMSNLGLEQALKKKGLKFERSKVGDRYVLEKLQEQGWFLGGETSGHILCLDKSTTGDGLLSALLVLSAMAKANKSLLGLLEGYKKYPQVMVNINIEQVEGEILENPVVSQAITDADKSLNDKGRIIVRKSGTEPLLRIMVEGENYSEVNSLASDLSDIVKSEIK